MSDQQMEDYLNLLPKHVLLRFLLHDAQEDSALDHRPAAGVLVSILSSIAVSSFSFHWRELSLSFFTVFSSVGRL